jgi:hypothetical protein
MFERSYNKKQFNEGKHVDTGEIDSVTGERKFIDTDSFIEKEDTQKKDKVETSKKEGKTKSGVCEYCESDPCKPDCDYR